MAIPFRTIPLTSGRTHMSAAKDLRAALDNPATRPHDGEHVFFDLDGTGHGIKASSLTAGTLSLLPAHVVTSPDGTERLELSCDFNAPVGVMYRLWNGTPTNDDDARATRAARLTVMRAHRARRAHSEDRAA